MKNIYLKVFIVSIFLLKIFIGFAQTARTATTWKLTGNNGTIPGTNFLGTLDNKDFIIKTNKIERIRFSASGNIGIGTKSPQTFLTIVNSQIATLPNPGSLIIGDINATNLAFDYKQIQARYAGQGATLFLNHLGGAVSIGSYNGQVFPAVWTNTDGRVGIGTNYALASGYAFTVEPSLTGNGIYVNDPGNGYSLYTVKTGSTNAAIHVEAKTTYTAAIEAFTHNAQRSIYGEDLLNGNGVEGRSYGGNAVVGVSTINVGILGIAPAYAGYFDGDVYSSGSYIGSDQNLKQNIQDFSDAMSIIDQLHPKFYAYRHDGDYALMNFPQGLHYGLIAQDVEKVLPNLVKDTKFETRFAKPDATADEIKNAAVINFKALNYTELIPIIIKGMQEQQSVNEYQQQQILQQQKQIDALQKTVDALLNNKNTLANSAVAYLQQNSPNPFSQNTLIKCYVPSSAKQSQLIIYNNEGKIMKSFMLNNTGMNEVNLNANTLPSGEYIYALLIDGKEIDSKHMLLTK